MTTSHCIKMHLRHLRPPRMGDGQNKRCKNADHAARKTALCLIALYRDPAPAPGALFVRLFHASNWGFGCRHCGRIPPMHSAQATITIAVGLGAGALPRLGVVGRGAKAPRGRPRLRLLD